MHGHTSAIESFSYLNTINIGLDVALVFMAIFMLSTIRGYGGIVGNSFQYVAWGSIFLGVSHAIETILLFFYEPSPEFIAFSHRFFVFIGFALIIWGFRVLVKK